MGFQNLYRRNRSILRLLALGVAIAIIFSPSGLFATEGGAGEGAVHDMIPVTFFWIAILLMCAKVSSLIEKAGQPAVLGELLIGVALGSLYLLGIDFFEPVKTSAIIRFLAELGVVLLLFQIGMESSVQTMMKVGIPSFLVACVGVVLPLVAVTYFVGPWLAPGLQWHAYLFIGATMTATSVGITARVLQDIGKSQTSEARIIIGAAVIDDVLGLIILAVVSAIVLHGSIDMWSLSVIIIKAVAFLGGGFLLGTWAAPRVSRLFSRIHTGAGMKFAIVISFGLVFAYGASLVGLAPIVGAFAAGLVLTPVYFDQFTNPPFVEDLKNAMREENLDNGFAKKLDGILKTHSHRHIEEFVQHLGHFLVPIFFVLTGMQVKLSALMDTKVLLMALGILVAGVITKVAAGWAAGKGVHHLSIGVGMVPRGEVGLIFANMGKAMGVMDDAVFSALVIVIMGTTLITPPFLASVFKKVKT